MSESQTYSEIEINKVPLDKRKDLFDKPVKFADAWDHPCPFQRALWREAITKEFTKMDNHKVWKKVKRSTIPQGKRCVKHKWVFE